MNPFLGSTLKYVYTYFLEHRILRFKNIVNGSVSNMSPIVKNIVCLRSNNQQVERETQGAGHSFM